MNSLHKQAAKESQSGGVRYVVYVPDEGGQVFDAQQVKAYGSLVFVEAVYIAGSKVADSVVA